MSLFSFSTCVEGELRQFYRLTPIAVIGGSFFPGLSGHNISEAAAAGCAVLTGEFLLSNPHNSFPHEQLSILPLEALLFC